MKSIPQKFPQLLSCALILVAAQCAFAADTQPIVGEAAMVIGVARITTASGETSAVSRGSAIHVGDRIETESGGHVHVRFIDGGRLSVRPSSRLQVENYSYSTQQSALTAIKFRLDEGVVRSITGAWGESARERFRLNTPVAAIGVKGTDFVVRSDADTTAASVYTGAIVFAALTDGCQASLGPCLNGGEKFLSQDMKGQMLELGRGQASPSLVPLVDLMALSSRRAAAERTAKAGKPSSAVEGNGRTDQSPTADKLSSADALPASGVTVSALQPAVKPELTTGPVLPEAPVVLSPPAHPSPPVVVAAPVVVAPPVVLPPPQVNQMVWGRYAWTSAVEADAISQMVDLARQNGRQVAVGNGAFSLYRVVSADGSATLVTSEAKAGFRLAGSSAQLVKNGGASELAQVDSGSLSLDFTRRTFATELAVSNATLGTSQVIASGTVANDGVFTSQAGNANVAGALSLDAKEAGYLFEKATPSGALRGLTLWGR